MIERIFVYHRDRVKLTEWIEDRGDICEADVVELLVDRHLDELESEFPKVSDRDNISDIKTDMRYERQCDARRGL